MSHFLIFTATSESLYFYRVVPFLWAGLWAALTTRHVKTCLREERDVWAEGGGPSKYLSLKLMARFPLILFLVYEEGQTMVENAAKVGQFP